MKLVSFVLASFIAAAATAAAKHTPVPWKEVANKDAKRWAFYSEKPGTNLEHAEPKYHKCRVASYARPADKKETLGLFARDTELEFQLIKGNVQAVNCKDCSNPSLANLYEKYVSNYIVCKKYENKNID